MIVELVQHSVSDQMVANAARVSTLGADHNLGRTELGVEQRTRGLLGYLMKNRHGSPFEHGSMTFRIQAPIFVWREFMRHRVGFSYNEESGRYRVLDPHFYIPNSDRLIQQIGKPGAYTFQSGTADQKWAMTRAIRENSVNSYSSYVELLNSGVAREVARMVLPLNLYSTAYVTCNPRSLMAFLSLRIHADDAMFPSYPQREIEMAAEEMERLWRVLMPLTSGLFDTNGRVAP
jgi:thymidylate synthase (FAD)